MKRKRNILVPKDGDNAVPSAENRFVELSDGCFCRTFSPS